MKSPFLALKKSASLWTAVLMLTACRPAPPPPHPPIPSFQSGTDTITGVVDGYRANRGGDLDKLVLRDGTGQTVLHFPPHAARRVLSIARKGTTVLAVTHWHAANVERGADLAFIQDSRQNALSVADIPPPVPTAGREVVLTGPFRLMKEGNSISGWTQANRFVGLPPHARPVLEPLLRNAKTMVTQGHERDSSAGLIHAAGLEFVRPFQVGINGTKYNIR